MKALLVLLATLLSAFPAVLLVLALAAFPVSATSYFVSTAGSDSNNGTSLATAFATIQKCSNMALGGDTCTMYGSPTSGTGSFAGWTQSDSGSSGSPITFTVHNGDTVTISSVVNVAGVSWITIGDPGGTGSLNGLPNSPSGCGRSATNSAGGYVAPGGLATFNIGGCFNFNNGHGIIGESISGTVTSHLTVSYNTFTGTPNGPAVAVCASTTEGSCGAGPQVNTSSDNLASHNQVNWNGANQFNAFEMYGDRLRLEYNDVTGPGDDFADIGGANMVVVRNYFHDINGATSSQSQHIDFVQIIGAGDSPTSTFSLLEENVEKNCTNNGGNCHFYLIRNGASTPAAADGNIARLNYWYNLDGGQGFQFGGSGDNVPDTRGYNNTNADGKQDTENGSCVDFEGGNSAPNGTMLNTICYNTTSGSAGWSPTYDFSQTGGANPRNNGNAAFQTGFSGSWPNPYASEPTESNLANKNPKFANFPTDGSLSSTSPMLGAGVAMTTANGSGSSSTSLIVNDPYFFQPGWGNLGGDFIRIGSSTVVQITAVNYATSTITLASAQSWSNGASIYLDKDTSGTVILTGTAPNVGAFGQIAPSSNVPQTGMFLVE